jgi:cell fate regulator YaaT (PSP1 superfamily)
MPKYVVRHGVMRNLGVFSTRGHTFFSRSHQVIARTHRGLESGEVLCEATEAALAGLKEPKYGQILRRVSEDDERELRKLHEQERREYEICAKRIKELNLMMRLVDVEHLYGGERIVVYYLADGRIDFRELVKLLAKEFQTRIEMRQIGVRDEAKLLADYGDCGKLVCCNTHLSEMPPVSMRMAKLQKATLDPSKISGRCGRLKCCLRYEYETYQELQKELPPIGTDIITNQGRAKVLAHEILASQLMIVTEDMRRIVIEASDVLTVLAQPQSAPKQDQNNPTDKEEEKPSQVGKMDSATMETPQGTEATESSASDSTPDIPQTTHIRSKQAATDHTSENPKKDNTEAE